MENSHTNKFVGFSDSNHRNLKFLLLDVGQKNTQCFIQVKRSKGHSKNAITNMVKLHCKITTFDALSIERYKGAR